MEEASRSEEQVLIALWACSGPATRRQIAAKLPRQCAWADSTLLNFLLRLQKKGFVRREREANRNVYQPLVKRQTYCAAAMGNRLELLYGNDLRRMLGDLADTGRMSYTEMELTSRWLTARAAENPEYDDE
jgi:predicted transcriptional regulator